MTSAPEILAHCRRLGLTLRPVGDRLAVRPAERATPELIASIRSAKAELLAMLEAERHQLHPSCAPWLHIARQVCAGEFDGGWRSQLESLLIGVRNIPHPACQQARLRLETLLGRKSTTK